jgi:hypothetical protein
MTFVDPGAIGECDARTQGGSIVETIGLTEDAAARRRVRPGGTIAHCVRASKPLAVLGVRAEGHGLGRILSTVERDDALPNSG